VDSVDFDAKAYVAAVRDVLGNVSLRADWAYDHITDAGILRQICAENGLNAAQCERDVRARFGELISDHLRRKAICPAIPGALRLLDELRSTVACHVGIATGGWGHTAGMKLKHAGYDVSGVPMTSSDDGYERLRIMQLCRERMPAASVTIYVGDGEWDRIASERLGWRFIGVGNRLRGKCQRWLPDFAAPHLLPTLLS
jgi:phosphoglycolate phosphatase-like HAD superfamily hydrolase